MALTFFMVTHLFNKLFAFSAFRAIVYCLGGGAVLAFCRTQRPGLGLRRVLLSRMAFFPHLFVCYMSRGTKQQALS